MRRLALSLMISAPLWLSGCDMLGIESASALAARKEAEGKAVGGACRHAGRAIEDCYAMNKKADKAAVFAGWREMNDYMRENKIEAVSPQLENPVESAASKTAAAESPEPDTQTAKAPKDAKEPAAH